jgi:hypothetical protein
VNLGANLTAENGGLDAIAAAVSAVSAVGTAWAAA